MECLFCQIVKGKIPSEVIFENKRVLAFLDVNPCSNGHTVVIPKKHYEKLSQIPDKEVKNLFSVVVKLAGKIQKQMKASAFNIGINDGEFAGQVIPHVHVHIIPRYKGDGGGSVHSIVQGRVNKNKLREIAEKIRR
ncbi:MAG: HIT family protein [Parcubacteria group bacterium CG_4_10_14_0_8_um_filter_35_7]|nr:MAG: HIT family protein [Parcubacteria group bacterium CG_4_10_14_0_8_um_filter_35_7]